LTSRDATNPFEADASVGSLGSYRLGARGDVALGTGATLRLAGARQSFDGFVPVRGAGRGNADTRADFDAYTLSSRLAARLGAVDVAADLGHFHEGRGSGVMGADSGSDGTTGSLTAVRQATPDEPGYRLSFWGKHSNLTNSSVAIAAGRTTTTPANNQYETPALGFGLNAALRGMAQHVTWELGADARYADGDSHELFRYQGTGFTRNRIAGGRQLVAGLYAEGSWTKSAWLFTAGVRVDRWSSDSAKRIESDRTTGALTLDQHYQDRSGFVPSGRFGVRYDFKSGAFLRSAAYSGFRPPSLNELHRPFRVGNDVTESNPDLKPEQLFGVEIGGGYERASTKLSATLFVNRVQDPIANVTLGFGPNTFPVAGFIPAGGTLRQRQNVGRIDAYGLEAEGEQRVTDMFALRGAVSLTHARVDGESAAPQLTGKRPAQAPRVSATAGFVLHPPGRLTFAADARYEGKRYDDDLNTAVLSAGVTADARLDLALTERVTIYLAADNIFDAKLETAQTNGVESYAAPRILRFGVHIKD
jgi:outer membrane receptor protein involved in Fe transport